MSPKKLLVLSLILAACAAAGVSWASAGTAIDDAWKSLPGYQYGQDIAPLLAVDRAVIEAMASPQTRSACAARLAGLLAAPETTPAARQYICLQLRQIGTPAEVPLLARLLADEATSEMARPALEAIPGEESAAALRAALTALKGKLLVGAINSLGARRDARSVAALQTLADAEDPAVASAALWALGRIANDEAVAFLSARAQKAETPLPLTLAVPLLRCADVLVAAGKTQPAQAIYARLSQDGQPSGVRRAGLDGLLRLQAGDQTATILAWFAGADPDRRLLAAGRLSVLSDEQLDRAADRLGQLPEASQRTLVEVLAARRGQEALPFVLSLVKSDKPDLKLAGIRCLGQVADPSVIPQLLDALAAGGNLAQAAQQALGALPRKEVSEALLKTLDSRPEVRGPAIGVLKTLKCYEAIDPLVALAAQEDPAVHGPALDGLRGIADPDKADLSRLVKLLLKTAPGKHRDEVEKTVLIVCEKLPAGSDRAEPVLAALAGVDAKEAPKYLPLLGRLGGPKARARIEAALAESDPAVKEAAVRALCNWPNAEVAGRLLELATRADQPAFRHWALRAYVRVVTLKSDRPDDETLAMLQNAMKLATSADDQRLILERASAVRTMDAVMWIAPYLDEPALAQAACVALVDLAHHRFLRHPNMARFGPLLEKVGKISKDPQVVERAKRYRLGL